MGSKRSKYDTNPLDEHVAHRADESFGRNGSGAATEDISGPTNPINHGAPETARAPNEEAPTRRMNEKVTSYPSVFVPPPPRTSTTYEAPRVTPSDIYLPPPPSNIYLPPAMPFPVRPGLNRVEGLGMAERWALIIPYIPAWLGIIGGFIELLLVPRSEARVRFHASQAIVLQLGMTALTFLLAGLGLITSRWSGVSLFRSACFIFLIIAMVKVWKGKPFVIAPLEEPRKWLEEKIKPRK